MPGALTIDSPCRAASPDRGCTSATYPSGSASATPVGTMARSPGASVTSTVVIRSAPASPGWAYDGQRQVGVEADALESSRMSAGHRAAVPPGTGGDPTLPGTPAMQPVDWLPPVEYAERLAVPLRWWVQGTMLVASLWLAVVVALPPARPPGS